MTPRRQLMVIEDSVFDTGPEMNARCDNCRHWHGETAASGRCDGLREPKAFVLDASDFGGSELQTAPDFGCALFEPEVSAL